MGSDSTRMTLAIWVTVGLAAGALIGAVLGNVWTWAALGVAVGAGLGAVLSARRKPLSAG